MKTAIEEHIKQHPPLRAAELVMNEIRWHFEPILLMVINDWTFRREQTGIDSPDSPEMLQIKDLLEKIRQ